MGEIKLIWQKLKKKLLPSRRTLRKHRFLGWLGNRLYDPRLWQWQRSDVAGGVSLGLLATFIPIPIQMIWGALFAFLFRVNLPIAVALTGLNNPFTLVPINYFIYKVGSWITHSKADSFDMPTWHWRKHSLIMFWRELSDWFPVAGKNYLIGLLVVCIGSAILGYLLVEVIWRLCVGVRILYRKLK